jgi:hypothetical protein
LLNAVFEIRAQANACANIEIGRAAIFQEMLNGEELKAPHARCVVVEKHVDITRRPRLAAGGGAEQIEPVTPKARASGSSALRAAMASSRVIVSFLRAPKPSHGHIDLPQQMGGIYRKDIPHDIPVEVIITVSNDVSEICYLAPWNGGVL